MMELKHRLRGSTLAALCAAMVATTASPVAHALAADKADAPSLEAGAPQLAETRYLLGRRLYTEGKYQDAAREFTSALDVFPTSAKLAFNLGRCLERMNDDEGALRAYRVYLANAPAAEDRGDVERLVSGLERRLEASNPMVTLSSEPAGAAVFVDDAADSAQSTPARLPVAPGAHVFRLRLAGYEEAVRSLTLARGATTALHVPLTSLTPLSRPATEPAVGATTGPAPAPPPGVPRWVGFTVLGTGAASLAVGGLFFYQAAQTSADAEGLGRTPGERREWRALEDEHGTQMTVAILCSAAGGLLVAGGAALVLLQPGSGESAGPVTLLPSPGGASVQGRF